MQEIAATDLCVHLSIICLLSITVKTLREIAEETGCTLKAIKGRWKRGLRGDDLRKNNKQAATESLMRDGVPAV